MMLGISRNDWPGTLLPEGVNEFSKQNERAMYSTRLIRSAYNLIRVDRYTCQLFEEGLVKCTRHSCRNNTATKLEQRREIQYSFRPQADKEAI